MARLLVELKLRLWLNALRASAGARVAFALSVICAAVVAGGVFYLLSILGGGIAAADLTTVIFSVFAVAWLIMPLIVFGLDSTLDPATLALYPIRLRPLATGLLAATATGPWPLATLIGLLGVTIGLARGALGVLIALLAVLLQVLFCITLARFVTTGLAGLLRSRRGKDLAVLLIIPIFAVYEGLIQAVPKLTSEGALTASSFGGVDLGCAGHRRAWPCTRSTTPPRVTPAPHCCAWRCWQASSSYWACCGSGPSPTPW